MRITFKQTENCILNKCLKGVPATSSSTDSVWDVLVMTQWYIPASSSLLWLILIAQSCSSGLLFQKILWGVLFFSSWSPWSLSSLRSITPFSVSRFQTTGGFSVSLEDKNWATLHGSVTSFPATSLTTCHSWKFGGSKKEERVQFVNWPLRLKVICATNPSNLPHV